MRAAAAQISRQRFLDLAIGGFGSFIEQRFGRHDHTVDAVAALSRLLIDEGLLDLVHLLGRAQAFQGRDGLILHGAHGGDAGADGVAIDDNGEGAALSQTAAELGTIERRSLRRA